MSYPGTFKDTLGQLYGIRSAVPTQGAACVEYKCSGSLYTQIDTDITVLDISIKDSRGAHKTHDEVLMVQSFFLVL